MVPSNALYYGDNLAVLRGHIASASIDLVYLDPPFQSNRAYNILFAAQDGTRAPAQIQAFDDTWRWDEAAVMAYHETLSLGGRVAEGMRALHLLLGDSDMMAYLAMMAPRLVEMHRVLKPTGSIYLHCDQTSVAHLRLLMDLVFGPHCFQNDIIWSYRRWPSPAGRFQRMHDNILFYSKSADGPGTFHTDYEENSPSYTARFKGKTQVLDPDTRTRKVTSDVTSKGLPRRDVWDMSIIAGSAKERLGYPTQKPLALLERIIVASTNPGDVVLDPFCGCGTAVDAAQHLDRRWIGIDVTHLAINLIKKRLRDRYPDLALPRVVGEPTTVDGAAELAATDPHGFQDWICALAGAQSVRPTNAGASTLRLAHKKGADRGIDGRLYFVDDASVRAKQIVLSVKSGHLQPAYVRELRGVMEREGAEMAALLTLHEPTAAMRSEAAAAGRYTSPGWNRDYPRLQIVTVAQLLRDERIAYPPPAQSNVTFKRASKARAGGKQPTPVTLPGMESAG
jgi:DNA modification methylase